MTEPSPAPSRDERRSPFQGLVPYGEADADWFFGRRELTEIIIDNLRAYRISILYGASGVGKSSVLNAGVVRELRMLAASSLAARGSPELVVVPFSSWSSEQPVATLKKAVRQAVEHTAPALARRPPTGRLTDIFAEWATRIGGPVLLAVRCRHWTRVRVRLRVRACLGTPRFASVRCNVEIDDFQHLSTRRG